MLVKYVCVAFSIYGKIDFFLLFKFIYFYLNINLIKLFFLIFNLILFYFCEYLILVSCN